MSSPQRENDDYDEEEAPVRSLPPKMAMKAPRRDDAPVAREVDGDDEEGEGEELGDEDDDDEEDDDDDEDDEEDEEDEGEDARGRRRVCRTCTAAVAQPLDALSRCPC